MEEPSGRDTRSGRSTKQGDCWSRSAERFRHQLHQYKEGIMPKMKTKSGAAKRFKVRGDGSVKRYQAGKRHILTKRTTKNKRQLRGSTSVHGTNAASVKAMLPYA
jgi:large subunit ribosomal protein L35